MQGQAERHSKSWGNRVIFVCRLQHTLGPMVGLVLRHQYGRVALRSPPFLHLVIANVPLKIVCTSVQYQAYCPAPFSSLFPLGKGHRMACPESCAWRESPYPCLFKVAITLWGEQIFRRMVTSGDIAVQINRAKGCWNYALQFKLLLGLFWRMHLW